MSTDWTERRHGDFYWSAGRVATKGGVPWDALDASNAAPKSFLSPTTALGRPIDGSIDPMGEETECPGNYVSAQTTRQKASFECFETFTRGLRDACLAAKNFH